jgi:hypothetical protein
MAPTRTIEIDAALLDRLRARHPGKDDRAMIEDMARIDLGFSLMHQGQERNGLDEDEAMELGIRAIRDSRDSQR